VKTVVAALSDPNPLVAGQGFARLKAAGVEVIVGPGAEVSRDLNIGFFSRMLRRTPWVRMKVAASLDGKTALDSGPASGSLRKPRDPTGTPGEPGPGRADWNRHRARRQSAARRAACAHVAPARCGGGRQPTADTA